MPRRGADVVERKCVEEGLRNAPENVLLSRTSLFGRNSTSRRAREQNVLEALAARGIGTLDQDPESRFYLSITITNKAKLLELLDTPGELSKLIWPDSATPTLPINLEEDESGGGTEDQSPELDKAKTDSEPTDREVLSHILIIMTNMAESVIRIREDVDQISKRVEALAKEWQIK